MVPEEFKSFDEETPIEGKWLIVTNNLKATNRQGEMSHVWLTTFWYIGSNLAEGLVTFTESDRKVINLTHWKYA